MCAGELPNLAADQDPTRFLHAISGLAGSAGMVLEAWSRMKVETSRGRARVKTEVRKCAHEAVMGSKKALHAYLKGLETFNTSALLGEDRRRGESLFDPNASLQLRASEWDSLLKHDKPSYRLCTKPSTLVVPKG